MDNLMRLVSPGWKAQLIATGLSRPRGLKFDSKGGLLVIEAGVGLRRLTFTDNGGTCLSVKTNKTVIADKELNHGLELSEDGRTLYVSSTENVYSYSYDPDAATVSNQQRLVFNMSNANGDHVTRTLLLSRKQPDLLLVSRGSSANIDPLAAQQSSGISQIRAFNISSSATAARRGPYNYPTDGLLVGWGLRNSVGVAEHPVTGGIWSVENSADDVRREGRDVHEDNPGEELNFHGVLRDPATLGANHGYPSCFALWNTTAFPALGNLTVGSQFAESPNATLNDTTCARTARPPRLTFRAHMAPLDLKFDDDDDGSARAAFVSFHGSWDRDRAAGYKLARVAFDAASGEPAEPSDSVAAAVDVLAAPDVLACPGAGGGGCMRPVGLALNGTGAGRRLFVSSDATGEIWVVMRAGEGGEGGGGGTATGTAGAPASSTSSAAAAVAPLVGFRGAGWGGWAAVVGVTVAMAAVGGLVIAG
ncbi:51f52ea8-c28f-4185-b048-a365b4bb6470 [Thermothielavioides terrestris]|uniref:51f52ea8-c28f-4185-b048-a365b4bb6470 n=1 Tax=Thermothielavioides terrestris TaxID=2587410 RepID=A0A446BWP8_9PEZI|nr:51f52ea8-c28f-4185-b048-a365b4bb6470 [Thermothielavioides terrestris]